MRTVSEVAEHLGITVRMLHHYDEIGLLRPMARSEAGYRLYDEQDIRRLREILAWRELGFSLAEIQSLLDDPKQDRRNLLNRQRERIAEQINRLAAIARSLDEALNEQERRPSSTEPADDTTDSAAMSDYEEARRLIIAELALPFEPVARAVEPRRGDRPVAAVRKGPRGMSADPASIRFLKQREADGLLVIAVSWASTEGLSGRGAYFLRRDGDGRWGRLGGHAGGGSWKPPVRGEPWVSVGCSGNHEWFCASGCVHEGAGIARVRLVFEDGLVLDDQPDAEGNVVFASAPGPQGRWMRSNAHAELLDVTDELVAQHRLFRSRPDEPSFREHS